MVPKLFKIGASNPDDDSDAHIVLAVVGFAADGNALRERLDTTVKMYRHQHNKPISLEACAQRLSHILYQKRFFPFYVTCILGGLDAEGKGALYSYDPVGSYERESCRAAGAASSLIMPFLDVCSPQAISSYRHNADSTIYRTKLRSRITTFQGAERAMT